MPAQAEDALCSSCGAELELASGDKPGPASAKGEEILAAVEVKAAKVAPSASAPGAVPAPAPAPALSSAPPAKIALGEESECRDLRISIDEGRIFMEGTSIPFRLRVESLHTTINLTDIRFRAENEELGETRVIERKLRSLSPGRHREFSVNYHPPKGFYGLMAFDWEVSYLRNGSRQVFEGQSEHSVYREDEDVSQVIDKVVFNIQTGHASDVEIKDATNFYQNLGSQNKLSVNALVDQARQAPRVWSPLVLYEATTGPGRASLSLPPPPAAQVGRLTLSLDGSLVHLAVGDSLSLGRDRRACDIATRIFNAHGKATSALNSHLSRRHCRLAVSGAECRVLDGGPEKGSACGTFVDGRRVEPEGAALPRRELFRLSLADGDAEAAEAIHLEGRMFACRDLGCDECPLPRPCQDREGIACVILGRIDEVPEHYVLLRRFAPLGRINPRFGRLKVGVADGGLFYQSARGADWLTPDQELILGDASVRVVKFGQYNIDRPESR